MGLFDFLRAGVLVAKSVRKVSQDNKKALDFAATAPMPDILAAWIRAQNRFAENWLCEPRAATDEGVLQRAGERLGAPLPADVAAFYRLANGIAVKRGDFPHPILPAAALVPAGSHRPALSAQLAAQWNDWGREQGQAQELEVFTTSLLDLAADRPESAITFPEADNLVPLTVPRDGACIAFVPRDGAYPAGTILEVENLCATRYAGLREWLAMSGARLDSIGSPEPS